MNCSTAGKEGVRRIEQKSTSYFACCCVCRICSEFSSVFPRPRTPPLSGWLCVVFNHDRLLERFLNQIPKSDPNSQALDAPSLRRPPCIRRSVRGHGKPPWLCYILDDLGEAINIPADRTRPTTRHHWCLSVPKIGSSMHCLIVEAWSLFYLFVEANKMLGCVPWCMT